MATLRFTTDNGVEVVLKEPQPGKPGKLRVRAPVKVLSIDDNEFSGPSVTVQLPTCPARKVFAGDTINLDVTVNLEST